MATWEYRVLRQKHANGDVTHAIHEVYHDVGDKKVMLATDKPVAVISIDHPHQLADMLAKMKLALDKPVLDYDDDFPSAGDSDDAA
jgi:hypothetical protein